MVGVDEKNHGGNGEVLTVVLWDFGSLGQQGIGYCEVDEEA